ncbi:hypothetical protein Ciccas_002363 [Cichlidogyrus casuarinus]|uniref:Bifunctional coenzyme A synthase n=1 Tax=Cichlidogyrus casuarinus TaxID=1844966 RepID=A0ABD2QHF5_9PLAT
MHPAHFCLLHTAAVFSQDKLIVGLTPNRLLEKKLLGQLISPIGFRMKLVREFLVEIGLDPSMIDLIELNDSFGPPGYEKNFQCIICSPETEPSCVKLNEHRKKQGLPELEIKQIPILSSSSSQMQLEQILPEPVKGTKMSSSLLRTLQLGSVLKPRHARSAQRKPFIIGLIGCAGSGKSSLVEKIKGTECYHDLVREFGSDEILDESGQIDRKKLGAIVFADKQSLQKLNNLVWPHIQRMALQAVNEITKKSDSPGSEVIMLDAAILLQAGWDSMCDEIWVSVVTRDEAMRRIRERSQNTVTEERAESILAAQAESIREVTASGAECADWWTVCQKNSTFGPISKASVVFSTEWSHEFTRFQVANALDSLFDYLNNSLQ